MILCNNEAISKLVMSKIIITRYYIVHTNIGCFVLKKVIFHHALFCKRKKAYIIYIVACVY